MKKLFMLLAVSFSLMVYAQQSDQQKLMSLLDLMNKNVNNTARLDSISVAIKNLGENTNDAAIKIMVPEAIAAINEARISNSMSKPLTVDLATISKDEKLFHFENDKFKNATFINFRKGLNRDYSLQPYISVIDNMVRLRLKTRYYGSNWLFMDTVIFNIDGVNYEYTVSPERSLRSPSGVSEKSDNIVDNNIFILLEKIANSPDSIDYRFAGTNVADRKFYVAEIEGVKEVLRLYKILTK